MRERRARLVGLGAAFIALVWSSAATAAGCPENGSPSTSVCKSYAGMLMPSATAFAYFPQDGGLGPWVGGGVELLLFTWSSNTDGFGPGQGKIRFDVAGLASTDGAPAMVTYEGGATVSFEGNASRNFLIPYFGGGLGGMHGKALGGHAYAEGGLGLYLVYLRGFILDGGAAFIFPFTDFETLAGPRAQLTASFALW